MKLQMKYATREEIPAGFEDLYEEKDGAFLFDGIEGGGPVKTAADVTRLDAALKKERAEHKATKEKLKGFGDLTPEALDELRSENETLKATVEAGGAKPDQAAIDKLVETRVAAKLKPLERDLATARQELATVTGERDGLQKEKRSRRVIDAVREATVGEKGVKVRPTAMADIELLAERVLDVTEAGEVVTRDGSGFTPGLDPKSWLADIATAGNRAHWFPENEGAGANGGKGGGNLNGNPFAGPKPNMTAIAQAIKANPKQARAQAIAAKQLELYEKLAGPAAA